MPEYVYECTQCEQQFDSREPMMAERKTDCPDCGGGLKTIPQGANFRFKAPGMFNQDMSHRVFEPSGNKPNRKRLE
jgi:putative FmdB family regulatory protein